jgi:DNA polymerase-4
VSVLPGIGRKTRERLERFNVRTVAELRRVSPELLEATFGAIGRELADYALGRDPAPVTPAGLPKSISRETTFEEEVMDRSVIEGMLYYLTERAGKKLRELGLKARTATVKLRYSDFETYVLTRSLAEATDQDHRVYGLIRALFRRLFTRRVRVRLVGVTLSGLSTDASHQRALFEPDTYDRDRRLYSSLDRIRERFGFSAVTAGESIALMGQLEQDEEGFRLRTPSLTR